MEDLINEGKEILTKLEFKHPQKEDVFNALSTKNIKVVILGQDPYPNDNAHGYAFSSLKTVPPSLKNVYKVLGINSTNGNLKSWSEQGVCLLNCYLTFPGRSPLWEPFIEKCIKRICELYPKAVFILWGEFAKKRGKFITNTKLEYCHPSPLTGNKFLNCPNFNECDSIIEQEFRITKRGKLSCLVSPKIYWDPDYVKPKHFCLAFTDGSWRRSVNKASYSVWFPEEVLGVKNLVRGYRRSKVEGNNIISEGQGILNCLKIFKYIKDNYYVDCHFVLVTDSEFWVKGINGEYKLTKNPELVNSIFGLIAEVSIYLRFIPSHGKPFTPDYDEFNGKKLDTKELERLIKEFREGNAMADKLAGELTN